MSHTIERIQFPSVSETSKTTKEEKNDMKIENQEYINKRTQRKVNEKIVSFLSNEERRDYSKMMSFTVDNDLEHIKDDALSFRILTDGRYEIGLHCADPISHIHPESSELKQLIEKFFDKVYNENNTNENDEMIEKMKNEHKLKLGKCNVFSFLVRLKIVERNNVKTVEINEIKTGRTTIEIKATFTFESFTEMIKKEEFPQENVRAYQELDKTTLIRTCVSFFNLAKSMKLIKPQSYNPKCPNDGSVLVKEIGKYVARIVGNKLDCKYGDLALIFKGDEMKEMNINSGKEVLMTEKKNAPFRSPLRRIGNCFVIRQIIAMVLGMEENEMIYYVTGSFDKETLEEIKEEIPKEYKIVPSTF